MTLGIRNFPGTNYFIGSYNYKKYSNYGRYKRDEDVEKREAEPEPEPAGKYTGYGL